MSDNRTFNTNAEEIFLLQSMDGGGPGGSGSVGNYLYIMATEDQAYGEPSVNIGEQSYATGINAFAMGNNTQAVEYCSFAFGKNSKVLSPNSAAIGSNNLIAPSFVRRGDLQNQIGSNFIIGKDNKINLAIYYNNNKVNEDDIYFGY